MRPRVVTTSDKQGSFTFTTCNVMRSRKKRAKVTTDVNNSTNEIVYLLTMVKKKLEISFITRKLLSKYDLTDDVSVEESAPEIGG